VELGVWPEGNGEWENGEKIHSLAFEECHPMILCWLTGGLGLKEEEKRR
jgi:hypothetical protein